MKVVELDQKLNVVILDFDDEKKRIALGLKQLTPHPWDALDPNLKVGDHVKGKVVVMADYGAFIEIAPGVEGLIHVSEMVLEPAPALCTGLYEGGRRSGSRYPDAGPRGAQDVSRHQAAETGSLGNHRRRNIPWAASTLPKVRNFTNFGVFVEIEEGVDGPDPHLRPVLDEEG